jgi:hypothetical protein
MLQRPFRARGDLQNPSACSLKRCKARGVAVSASDSVSRATRDVGHEVSRVFVQSLRSDMHLGANEETLVSPCNLKRAGFRMQRRQT